MISVMGGVSGSEAITAEAETAAAIIESPRTPNLLMQTMLAGCAGTFTFNPVRRPGVSAVMVNCGAPSRRDSATVFARTSPRRGDADFRACDKPRHTLDFSLLPRPGGAAADALFAVCHSALAVVNVAIDNFDETALEISG